jgi:hypothetical protein
MKTVGGVKGSEGYSKLVRDSNETCVDGVVNILTLKFCSFLGSNFLVTSRNPQKLRTRAGVRATGNDSKQVETFHSPDVNCGIFDFVETKTLIF